MQLMLYIVNRAFCYLRLHVRVNMLENILELRIRYSI